MRILLCASLCFSWFVAGAAIEKIPLKDGWKFIKDDDPKIVVSTNLHEEIARLSSVLDRAEKGDRSGAIDCDWAKPGFDDSGWKSVRVPHDWGVDSSYDPELPYGDAFLDVTGIGWYRLALSPSRPLTLSPSHRVLFQCDGAMSYAMLWVNGRFAGGWPYGYTRWQVDITDFLKSEGNVIAIRCHNVKDSSRWYTGGGLFRNCRLLVCPEDYVIPGSVHITTPEITKDRAKVHVRYEMTKSGVKDYSFEVKNPRLWDIDDPYLYSVDIEGNEYRYGIRTISFNADERKFQLNGRTVPLNGVSMHHDFGVLGAAWNRTAQKRRLLEFKAAGVNAIRSSHNPPDEELLELCDELGLLFKDEVFDEWRYIGNSAKRANGYTRLFDVWHERDLRAWVRNDRNHPCVIMWSIGNEICDGWPGICPYDEWVARTRQLAKLVAEEDLTRPVVNANNNHGNYTNEFPRVLPVLGCNYHCWMYPKLVEAHPDVPFFGSETVCMSVTRGEYNFALPRKWSWSKSFPDFVNSAYCWEACNFERIDSGWATLPDAQWFYMDQVKTCMGEFIWTGVDYLGGPAWIDAWRQGPVFTDPAHQAKAMAEIKATGRCSDAIHTCNTGFLDQAGFRKDSFYLYQSRWAAEKPMAHILPHWTWPGREGRVTPVYVFTSGDEGELFLNGKSLGRQKKDPSVWDRAYRLRWDDVVYEPGKLEVVAYKGGREWARDAVETVGAAAALRVEVENSEIVSDGEDLAYVNVRVVDEKGRLVPSAADEIAFSVEGEGCVLATDNGDERDMSDFRLPRHRAFHGLVQALVRAKPGFAGALRVTASANGLAGDRGTIRVTGKK